MQGQLVRKYGYIGNAYFSHQGFSIRNLAEEYKIVCNEESKTVYVNSMSELKHEIAEIYGERERELQEKDEI